MKKFLGSIRRASDEFGLIEQGDTVAVGVSGGKDSVALLYALKEYQHYSNAQFDFFGICVDLGNEGFDVSDLKKMCEDRGIKFYVVKSDIAKIVFDVREEKSPCSLCAKLRKGALINEAKARGANKVAVGHHRDDLLETFIMSMLYEGRLTAMQPKTYLDRKDITQIRPMIYLEERYIINFVKKYNLPICKSFCRVDGDTKREEAKEIMSYLVDKNEKAREIMTTAITKKDNYKLW